MPLGKPLETHPLLGVEISTQVRPALSTFDAPVTLTVVPTRTEPTCDEPDVGWERITKPEEAMTRRQVLVVGGGLVPEQDLRYLAITYPLAGELTCIQPALPSLANVTC